MVEETKYGRWRPFFHIADYDSAVQSQSLSHPHRSVVIRPFSHGSDDESGWEVIAWNGGKHKKHGPFRNYREAVRYARKHRDERAFYEE